MEQNITVPQIDYTFADAMQMLTTIYKNGYIASKANIDRHYITIGTTGYNFGGMTRPGEKVVSGLNQAVQLIGNEIWFTRITADDTLAQLKVLGKKMELRNLFCNEMGWTYGQLNGRLHQKTASCYGKFRPEELTCINQTIIALAAKTLQIHIADSAQEKP